MKDQTVGVHFGPYHFVRILHKEGDILFVVEKGLKWIVQPEDDGCYRTTGERIS